MNVVAFFHAYKFTHFTTTLQEKTKSPDKLTTLEKLKALLLGVNNPRPVNGTVPAQPYETVQLQSNKKIEGWYIPKRDALGKDIVKKAVILFHGYGGDKSSLLEIAALLDSLGYATFLVDFMGSGGSEGNVTTIGYKEAAQVRTAYEYIINKGVEDVFLFGTSMGAVAIMKAISEYNVNPKGIIIECPFGSLYQTVGARFDNMNVPRFPMTGLLVFWGGVQNGFWGFAHNPVQYAKQIHCPALLLYGEQDKSVVRKEVDAIFHNLRGKKKFKSYREAGHENYLLKYRDQWIQDVSAFLVRTDK